MDKQGNVRWLNEVTRAKFLRNAAGAAASVYGLGALAGCGDSPGTGSSTDAALPAVGSPPGQPTGTLRFTLPAPPLSLDPAATATQGDRAVVRTVCDGLVAYDSDYTKLVPALAKSWEENDAATEWTIHLRPGVKFHDGEPLDSTAVKKNLLYMQRGALTSLVSPAKFTKLDDSDPLTLHVATADPYPDFIRNQVLLGMVSPKSLAKGTDAVNKHLIGTGPYRFSSYQEGQKVSLDANPDYWGAGPYYEAIDFAIVEEESSRINALLTGQVDLYPKVGPTQIAQLSGTRVKKVTTEAWSGMFMVPVANRPPFNDVRVRQALAYATDKEAIISAIVRGQAEVADSMAPKGTLGYAEPQTKYSFDPAKAKQLIDAAGAKGAKVTICVSKSQYLGPQISEAVAAQLRDVGLDANASVVDPTVQGPMFTADPDQSRYQMFMTDHYWLTGGPLIQYFVAPFSRFDDKRLRAIYKKMQTTVGTARQQAFDEFEEFRAQQAIYTPLFHTTFTDGLDADVQRYVSPKDGFMPVLGPVYSTAA